MNSFLIADKSSSPYPTPRVKKHILYCDLEEDEVSWTLANSRIEPVYVKEALSLLDRVHLFAIQNEGLQHATEGIINMIESITICSRKQT